MTNQGMIRIGKRLLLGFLCAALLFFIVNAIVNRATLNPYRDGEDTDVCNVLTQLLSPAVSYSWLDQMNPDRFNWFGAYTQRLLLDQFPDHSTEEKTVATLQYQRGKISVAGWDDGMGFGSLTCRQGIFMKEAPQEGLEWNVSADQQYEAWLRLARPMDTAQFSERYGWLLDNQKVRQKGSGLIWLAIKTSPNESDVCLGSIGNQSMHYLLNPIFGNTNYYRMDLLGREEVFRQSLQYLVDRPEITQAYQRSGLYPGGEDLDFSQRLSYIEDHGIEYLGMVGYLRGDVLLSLQQDDNLSLIKLVER